MHDTRSDLSPEMLRFFVATATALAQICDTLGRAQHGPSWGSPINWEMCYTKYSKTSDYKLEIASLHPSANLLEERHLLNCFQKIETRKYTRPMSY